MYMYAGALSRRIELQTSIVLDLNLYVQPLVEGNWIALHTFIHCVMQRVRVAGSSCVMLRIYVMKPLGDLQVSLALHPKLRNCWFDIFCRLVWPASHPTPMSAVPKKSALMSSVLPPSSRSSRVWPFFTISARGSLKCQSQT